jgi:hypothetical protein
LKVRANASFVRFLSINEKGSTIPLTDKEIEFLKHKIDQEDTNIPIPEVGKEHLQQALQQQTLLSDRVCGRMWGVGCFIKDCVVCQQYKFFDDNRFKFVNSKPFTTPPVARQQPQPPFCFGYGPFNPKPSFFVSRQEPHPPFFSGQGLSNKNQFSQQKPQDDNMNQ